MSKLSQDSDQMFERNLSIIASKEEEALVFLEGQSYEGYICGLDEYWVQLYGHEPENRDDPDLAWRFVLIRQDNIQSLTTSGRRLTNEKDPTKGYIKKKISSFSSVAKEYLETRKSGDERLRQ